MLTLRDPLLGGLGQTKISNGDVAELPFRRATSKFLRSSPVVEEMRIGKVRPFIQSSQSNYPIVRAQFRNNGGIASLAERTVSNRVLIVALVAVVDDSRGCRRLVPVARARPVERSPGTWAGRDGCRNLASSPECPRGSEIAHQPAGERSGRDRRRPRLVQPEMRTLPRLRRRWENRDRLRTISATAGVKIDGRLVDVGWRDLLSHQKRHQKYRHARMATAGPANLAARCLHSSSAARGAS